MPDENESFADEIDPPVAPDEPDETPAHEQLADAEAKLLGEGVAMHDGKPERGIGSRYHGLHPAHKARLAALEHLVETEKARAVAQSNLGEAEAKHEHARARVEATAMASDEVAAAEAEKARAELDKREAGLGH